MYTAHMHLRRLLVAIVAAGLALVLGGARAAAGDAEAAAQLREQIAALIGEASCRNLVSCRLVGLGVRPCGGPDEYVAYSSWNTAADELGILVSEYNLLKEDLMLDRDAVASCERLPKPEVDCISGRCVTVPTGN